MVEIDEFKEYDKNGDWKLTSDEAPVTSSSGLADFRQNIKDELQSRTIRSEPDKRMMEWAASRMKKLDQDNDGMLTPAEFGKGDFKSVDINKDGKIDLKEYTASRMKK